MRKQEVKLSQRAITRFERATSTIRATNKQESQRTMIQGYWYSDKIFESIVVEKGRKSSGKGKRKEIQANNDKKKRKCDSKGVLK